ncbi:MAG TPA: hypothetical protein VEQ36_17255 [Thermomicrobiales bacterium]|nr:hypothetical protein [Thermomicrobiales bacterium]
MREERQPRTRRPARPRAETPPDDDPLEIPRWTHPRVTAYDLEPEERRRSRSQGPRRITYRSIPARSGHLLGMGLAPGITSLLALFVSVVPGLSGTGDIPIGIVVILLLQVVGLAMMSRVEGNLWGPSWISVGFLVSVMLPMVALQVSLLHEPYVSIGMGSAGPALLATLFVLGLYGAFAIWVTWTSQRRPEIAAVLLMPSTLAIPAMIGEHGSIDQKAALMILSEVTLITAIAAAVVWLFPGWPQLLAGGGALAIELVRLWVAGRGPWRHETSGAIVSVVYITMLVAAVLVVVLVPVMAAILNMPAPARRVPSPRRRR